MSCIAPLFTASHFSVSTLEFCWPVMSYKIGCRKAVQHRTSYSIPMFLLLSLFFFYLSLAFLYSALPVFEKKE